MTEQAIIVKRQQEQIKRIRHMQTIKDKQEYEKCVAFWSEIFKNKKSS